MYLHVRSSGSGWFSACGPALGTGSLTGRGGGPAPSPSAHVQRVSLSAHTPTSGTVEQGEGTSKPGKKGGPASRGHDPLSAGSWLSPSEAGSPDASQLQLLCPFQERQNWGSKTERSLPRLRQLVGTEACPQALWGSHCSSSPDSSCLSLTPRPVPNPLLSGAFSSLFGVNKKGEGSARTGRRASSDSCTREGSWRVAPWAVRTLGGRGRVHSRSVNDSVQQRRASGHFTRRTGSGPECEVGWKPAGRAGERRSRGRGRLRCAGLHARGRPPGRQDGCDCSQPPQSRHC